MNGIRLYVFNVHLNVNRAKTKLIYRLDYQVPFYNLKEAGQLTFNP